MIETKDDLSNKKPRLGRGLSSLLGEAQAPQPSTPVVQTKVPTAPPVTESTQPRVWSVGIDKIFASSFQPRTHFDKVKLEELSQSIKQNGILQPIVARKRTDGKFEIIAGERRFRAAQLAGLHEVPLILKTFNNRETLELALIENLQREDLNVIEAARAMQRLVDEFSLTQQQVAERLGKERSSVANHLRLLQLSESIQDKISSGNLSFGHAKVLLSLDDQKMAEEFAEAVVAQQLSVRALETLVLQKRAKKQTNNKEQATDAADQTATRQIKTVTEELQKILGTRVAIDYSGGKGKVAIYFYSDDDFNQLVDTLKG